MCVVTQFRRRDFCTFGGGKLRVSDSYKQEQTAICIELQTVSINAHEGRLSNTLGVQLEKCAFWGGRAVILRVPHSKRIKKSS